MAKEEGSAGNRAATGDSANLEGISASDIGILDAIDLPIVIITRDCRVARINRAATTVLHITASDIGRPLGHTLAGVKNLGKLCARVMAEAASYRDETRDGDRCFLLRIAPYTGNDNQILGAVLTFTNVTAFRASIDQAVHEREYTKAILNSVADPLVVLDTQLRIQTANRAFYAMFGVSRDETQNVPIRELGNKEWDTSEAWKSLETTSASEAEFPAGEIEHDFPGIGRRIVALRARRLPRAGEDFIILTFQDVTEQKLAARTTSLLAAIVSSSDDAIVSKTLDGIITSWNQGAERMFGYDAAEAIGQHIRLIVPADRWEEETKILEQLKRGKSLDHFETIRRHKDGTRLDISLTISPIRDAAGRLVGASKVARNVTQQKSLERAQAERARLLDLTSDAVIVRDLADRVTYWNKPATELYGYTREEALGRVTHELLCTEFPTPQESIANQLHRDDRWTGELVHRRKDGTQIVVASRWVLDRDVHGAPRATLETNNDITERKRAEQARREAELSARLLLVQDQERKRIARELHDGVGQLLAAIGMNVGPIIRESGKLSPTVGRAAEEIASLLAQASSDIRTVSHLLHPPLLDEIGLHTALKWYIDGFAERSKIKVQLDLTPDLPRLSQDYELSLFRIAQESLTNIHRHSESFTAFVRLSHMRGKIELEVRDQGKGIRQEIQVKLNSGESVGVGFRGMQERMRMIGGKLTVHSDGNGTSVLASLPIPEDVSTSGLTETSDTELRQAAEGAERTAHG